MRVSTVAIATIIKLATAYVAAEHNVDETSSVSSSSPHQKRSAINRINSRQQRQVIKGQEDNSQNTYDPYLGLSSLSRQQQQQQRREGGASRRELQDMSMSMAEIDNGDMCAFCPNGLSDPSFVLPTDDGATCEMASAFANTLLPTDPICATVQLAKVFCCKPEPETPEVGTIVDIAVGNPDFSILVSAVTAAGLVDTLSGDGPFTVFAPTDDAFRALPADTLDALLLDVDQLTSVLTYHVVSGKVASTDLVNGPVPTVNGADVTVDLTDGVKINDANVISPDIEASNGIIHVIDKVLLPPISSTSSTTTTMEAEQPELPPLENGQCSCSPLEYNFILNLDSNCETNDIDGQPGIGLTFCFLGVSSPPSSSDARVYFHEEDIRRNRRRLRNTNTNKNHRILSELQRTIVVEDPNSDELSVEQQQQIRFLAEDIEIISIQFLEFDTSGELIVINQDDSYSNASLAHGSVVTFESIANNLDPDVPITDQLDFLPGGVQVTLRGKVTDDVTGDTRIVSNRITWSYTNACDVSPVLESGESIGWITNGDLTPASQAFCPAAPAPPATTTTTTEAPPTTTTTEAPPVTTEAPPTTTTTDAPLPPVTDEPPLFSKSQKAAKDKKTDSKTHKTPKNPMAKVYKDKGSGKGCTEEEQAEPVSEVDTKSAKAKVDLDAKAEKSSKGAKSKSSKAKCDTEDSKKTSSKATKLFKEGPKKPTHSAMSV